MCHNDFSGQLCHLRITRISQLPGQPIYSCHMAHHGQMPLRNGSIHSGGDLAPSSGLANTTTAGLLATIKTFKTDCSSGE